jgi:hypothetical protein
MMKQDNINGFVRLMASMVGEKKTFQYSHYMGTIKSNRARWSHIKKESNNTGDVYLGSMLFEDGVGPYQKHTIESFVKSLGNSQHKKIHVVQVVEPHEIDNPINPNFLNLATDSQALQHNSAGLNIIGPIQWGDFGYTIPEPKKLQQHLEELCEAHNNKEIIYFHCKAGVNRSFRMSALFCIYQQLKSKSQVHELELDDIIMQTCSDIWDARPCTCFNRHEWLAQFNSLKSAIQIMLPTKITSGASQENRTDAMRNNYRLNMQYELYRYRHHLHQQAKKHTHDSAEANKASKKKDKVQEFITASKYTRTENNLTGIHAKFTLKMQEKDSITAIKQARNSGFISLCQSIFRFLFRLPKTKGVKVIKRIKKINRCYDNVSQITRGTHSLCSFFGVHTDKIDRIDNEDNAIVSPPTHLG